MDELFKQIKIAADAGLYFLALAGALMIPDVCAALESPDGETTGQRYVAWFDRHVAPKHWNSWENKPLLAGDSCYRFRCSFLRQGSTQHPKSDYSRIVFVEPNSNVGTFHMNVLNDALNVDVGKFCTEMVELRGVSPPWERSRMSKI